MNNKGWVKFHRVQFSNWISKKPFCDGYAWTYLYTQANHKKGMVNFRNEYIKIERGQFLTSKLKLQKIFGWTYRHVENFLLALKNDENITYRTTNRYIVITVVNYDIYQSYAEQNDEQNVDQSKNRLGTDYKRGNTNKNEENVKNVKNKKDITKVISSVGLKPNYVAIVNYLNEKTGRNFNPKNKSTMDMLRARFNEGRTMKDFVTVIDKKVESWQTDDKMNKFLRPSTLFSLTNFENYINEPEEDKYAKYMKKE